MKQIIHDPFVRCPYCSFNPTSSSDFCDEHRPRSSGEIRVGDWVKYGNRVVEITVTGQIPGCRDTRRVTEIRTRNGKVYR